jgi:hypothetical protein
MPQRKFDLLFWGYVASVLHSLLKPYKQGAAVQLTDEDKEIVERSEKLLDSMLKGCDIVDSLGKLSFTHSHSEVPSATALNLAIEIFSAMAAPVPQNPDEFREKLSNYRKILENLRKSQPIVESDSPVAEEVTSFFKALSNKADQESYEATYSL